MAEHGQGRRQHQRQTWAQWKGQADLGRISWPENTKNGQSKAHQGDRQDTFTEIAEENDGSATITQHPEGIGGADITGTTIPYILMKTEPTDDHSGGERAKQKRYKQYDNNQEEMHFSIIR